MKVVLGLVLVSTAISGLTGTAEGDSEQKNIVETKITESFKDMYAHLGYVSHYIGKRASEIAENHKINEKVLKRIQELSSRNCAILGLKDREQIPYLKSTRELNEKYKEGKEETYRDLKKVESDIGKALRNISEMVKIWKRHFEGRTESSDWKRELARNEYVYPLLFNDYLLIFYEIAGKIVEAYKVEPREADGEEMYAKGIFLEGLKAESRRKGFVSAKEDMEFADLTKSTFVPNTLLLERVFYDMERQIPECSDQMETVMSVFHKYKRNMELM
ncbi:conserved hypothetical protein [Theileria orientalis strain Shintoku]|uniref:Uncharacterized protein n=1 Tax=Theileria orientalis strain Shintoku TaxID=869250 RepID=J4DNW8_THEOR|nr:conserved hypothetical protein [Theileria orientalis strain Shintoku]PVC52452.1 hypothetical protein MACL_00000760 [Theileria orientalis]BAM39684.1 conserved hypothetical protein [Theileria orientalis strain Shintoku]|eukprot:XP_009689985.1 conserved hypothetical protein [Theileria orientalis strain Shintoku]